MAVIEKFLGQRVTIPEDRLYAPKTGLWAKAASQDIIFGLTEPALVLAGGANSLDWLVDNRQSVKSDESVRVETANRRHTLSISRIGRFGPTRILSSRGRFEIASAL